MNQADINTIVKERFQTVETIFNMLQTDEHGYYKHNDINFSILHSVQDDLLFGLDPVAFLMVRRITDNMDKGKGPFTNPCHLTMYRAYSEWEAANKE